MLRPWTPDYLLSEAKVESVLKDNVEFDVHSVTFLGEGWDFFNYHVNDHWVFRFPKRKSEADTLLHENRILNALDIPINHPRFEFWIPRPRNFHLPIAGYKYLEGVPLVTIQANAVNLEAFGQELGNVLAVLHRQNLTGPRRRTDPLKSWFAHDKLLKKDLKMAEEYLSKSVHKEISKALHSYVLNVPEEAFVTAHDDLGVEHILVGPDQELHAIIDWADTNTANRYVDFAGVWAWGGDVVLRHMLSTYDHTPTSFDLARLRALGLCYLVGQIEDAHELTKPDLMKAVCQWAEDRVEDRSIRDIYTDI